MTKANGEGQQPFFHPLNEACELIGLSRATGYRMLLAGRWTARKYGTKNLIPHSEVARVAAEIEAGTFKPVTQDEIDAIKEAAA